MPVPGAPCWVNLLVEDLAGAKAFYSAVLGWEFGQGSLGAGFSIALAAGRPVAGLGTRRPGLAPAVAWAPYFAVRDADKAASRIRERGATLAVGPLRLGEGRAGIAADREGAVFGFWEGAVPAWAVDGAPVRTWAVGEGSAPARLDLETRDMFGAAVFYGEVFEWAKEMPDRVDVDFRHGHVVVAFAERTALTLHEAAARPDEGARAQPRWMVNFEVDNLERAVRTALLNGGARPAGVSPRASAGFSRVLQDPEGALFTVSGRQVRSGGGGVGPGPG